MRGMPCAFSKVAGTSSLGRISVLSTTNGCEETGVLSLKDQTTPPSKFSSVHKVSRFCRNRIQNDDLPEPLGPHMLRVNCCLNCWDRHPWIISAAKPHEDLSDNERGILSYLYINGKDVFSCNRRLLRKDILYILSSGSMIIDTTPLPFPLRLIFFSLCTVSGPPFFQNNVLNGIIIDQLQNVISLTNCLSILYRSINYLVWIIFGPALTNSSIHLKGFISKAIPPRFSPVSTIAASFLGWTNKTLHVSQ